jgi:hypothetical protein
MLSIILVYAHLFFSFCFFPPPICLSLSIHQALLSPCLLASIFSISIAPYIPIFFS